MKPSLPPSYNARRCDTCSGEGNDTDCRSGKFQLKASDPEKGERKKIEEFNPTFCDRGFFQSNTKEN